MQVRLALSIFLECGRRYINSAFAKDANATRRIVHFVPKNIGRKWRAHDNITRVRMSHLEAWRLIPASPVVIPPGNQVGCPVQNEPKTVELMSAEHLFHH